MRLYFDSFVFDLIGRRNEAAQIRRWRKANRHEIGVSLNATIVEAVRIPDLGDRDARLKTILQVGTKIHPPYDYRHYQEMADELWRLRPRWFRQAPERRRTTAHLRKRKREWLKLKDPSRQSDLGEERSRIYSVIGRDMNRQKQYRRLISERTAWFPEHSLPEVQACIERRSRPDVWWRYVVAEESPSSFAAELRAGGFLEWLVDFKWPQAPGEWHRFWMCDADGDRLPLCRIIGLAEFFQRQRKVTAGNPIDRLGHAPHLLGFDLLLTTDRRFFEVLTDTRAEMAEVALGRPILLDPEAPSALAAISDAVGQGRALARGDAER